MILPIPHQYLADNPWQTRQRYDDGHVNQLARGILKDGLLQKPAGRLIDAEGEPVDVTDLYRRFQSDPKTEAKVMEEVMQMLRTEGAGVQLVFGHNRVRAFRALQRAAKGVEQPAAKPFADLYLEPMMWDAVPVELKALTDEQMADQAWRENDERAPLNPIEEALAFKKRMDDFGLTQGEVAERYGLKRPTVTNALKLLRLPEDFQQALAAGEITKRQADALYPATQMSEEDLVAASKSWEQFSLAKLLTVAKEGRPSKDLREFVGRMKKLAESGRARAEQVAKARAEFEAAKSEHDGELVDVSGQSRGKDYETIYSSAPTGCTEACACRVKAILYGSVVDVCTDPKQLKRLARAQKAQQRDERRAEIAPHLDKLRQRLATSAAISQADVLALTEELLHARATKDGVAAAVLTMDLPEEAAGARSYDDAEQEAARAVLRALTPARLLSFTMLALVYSETEKYVADGWWTRDAQARLAELADAEPWKAPLTETVFEAAIA